MTLKMLAPTTYGGRYLRKGDEVTVSNETAECWIRDGKAAAVAAKPKAARSSRTERLPAQEVNSAQEELQEE